MAKKRGKKIRVAFRKNRENRTRSQNLTRDALDGQTDDQDAADERISGRGQLTRYRTIVGVGGQNEAIQREIDEQACLTGRVLRAIGANRCDVQTSDKRMYVCTVRRVLRTMLRDSRNAVVAGDRVMFLPTGDGEGVIERVEPRQTVLSRGSGRFEHIIAANVDQLAIIASASEPRLKPALIDRFLVSAARGGVRPVICINKADLVDQEELHPIIELYTGLGYDVITTVATDAVGIEALREMLVGRETVFAGQSGVGKSSLLNAVQPGLGLRTSQVSDDSGKGRHTTRTTELIPLAGGGWVADTPGVRQMSLWDVAPEEVEAYFVEFPKYVADCHYPDCTHTHETGCTVKSAVEEGHISPIRYESYLRMFHND
ncbi:MAG: ribosome small subunit-dependent GTPase A [Planctomycetaceae bacterium]|nr:ribosome small subunit-dependent GTPase A [Planctomycetaceae bacterium]